MGEEVAPTPVPTPPNTILLQAYEWNVPADKKHWKRLLAHIEQLKDWGVNTLWLPPGCKAAGGTDSVGYDVYDVWDLGEFDQKGTIPTKWGTKEELIALGTKAKELKMGLYWDAVLNHKAGADQKEKCKAQEVDQNDRNKKVSDVYEINGWLGFDFEGRKDKYSKQKYHWYHFTGTDYNADNEKTAIYMICGDEGKGWSNHVSDEQGNGDFLMFADLDYEHQEVVDDVTNWGHWILKEVPGLCGFRMDAVQHFSEKFTDKWVEGIREEFGKEIFFVGEYFSNEASVLQEWLEKMHGKFSLFDTPLMYNFSKISTTADADMRKVFDKTLVQEQPVSAVTFVTNHDTQPGQTVETPIEGFFKPLAYALILLRREGYPCVFYGDLYGTKGDKAEPPSCGGKLAHMMLARKCYAYGDQDDYWDEKNCIGFVRRGTHDYPHGLACIMSNTGAAEKQMHVGKEHRGETWTDLLGWSQGEVVIDDEGNGKFQVSATSMAIYVNKDAKHRDLFERKFDDDIYKV